MNSLFAKYFIGSRIARRTLLLFVVCALVPIIVLSIQNNRRVDSLFQEQLHEELKRSAKGVGLMLFERFQYLDRQLEIIREEIDQGGIIESGMDIAALHASLFDELRIIDTTSEDIGASFDTEIAPAALRNQLNIADSTTVISEGQYPKAGVWMLKKLGSPDTAKAVAVRIRTDYLWQELEGYDAAKDFQVNSSHGRLLYATGGGDEFPADAGSGPQAPEATWQMFLGNIHFPENWRVTASVSDPGIVINDRETFLKNTYATTLLALLLATLVGIYAIRKSTEPIEALREGINYIQKNNFTHQVDIHSNDEFELLGNAFNTMTGKLDQHITAIRSLSSIDQLILGHLKIEDIIRVVLKEGIRLLKAENLFLFIPTNDGDRYSRYASGEPGATSVLLNPEVMKNLHHPSRLIRWRDTGLEPEQVPGSTKDSHVYSSFLMASGEIKAVLVAEFNNRPDEDTVGIAALFADHVAIALSNADWESRLYKQANYDSLTGLPNRYHFNEQLAASISQAPRTKQNLAVLFIDIDDFKMINEAMSQEGGDHFLSAFGRRMENIVGDEGLLARLGGDEFGLIYYCDQQSRSLMNNRIGELAAKLLAEANQGLTVDDREIFSSVSIGISVFPFDSENASELLKYADEAKRRAKENGKNRVNYFSDIDNYSTVSRLDFINELRRALSNNELELYYQPKVNTAEGKMDGCEALIRWNHPVRGVLSPYYFIPQAEEYGMIEDIGRWVIRTAAGQQADWISRDIRVGRVAVNVSVLQLLRKDFYREFVEVLEETGCPGYGLEVEITETAYVEDMQYFREHMENLSKVGLTFSVDDYGTGYSSLSLLLNLPVTQFKIDKSFIDEVEKSEKSFAIVETTIMLAKKVGFKVVAEGVETSGQLKVLQQLGCDCIQGYYFSMPVQAHEIERMAKPGYFLPALMEAPGNGEASKADTIRV